MLYIGIDNGITGGIVTMDESGKQLLHSSAIPIVTINGQTKVDGRELLRILKGHGDPSMLSVCLEKYHYSQRVDVAYSMADSFAVIRTVALLLGIKVTECVAKDWQPTFWKRPKDANQTGWTTKTAALEAAGKLFPNGYWYATPRSTTPHEGIVDALLIAEYHRRNTIADQSEN